MAPRKFDTITRVPPHDINSEMGLLGSLLLGSEDCVLDEILAAVDTSVVKDGFFYYAPHAIIFEAIRKLRESHTPVDIITLRQQLQKTGDLENAGGVAFISGLINCVPTAANAEFYLEICREKYNLRSAIKIGTQLVNNAYDAGENTPDAILDEAENAIVRLRTKTHGRILTAKAVGSDVMATIETLAAKRTSVCGLSTGFYDLDKLTAGLADGDLILVAGRPASGKTSLALNIVEHVIFDLKLPVAVVSAEMTAKSLGMRLVTGRARVNARDITGGFLTAEQRTKLTTTTAQLMAAPLFIDETSNNTAAIRATLRLLKRSQNIRLAVIDYVQLLHEPKKFERREEEVAFISNGLKRTAKELGIPIVALCQLNRGPEERDRSGRPRLADLRNSGQLENDADVVLLIYRPEMYARDVETKQELKGKAILEVAKQRNGPTGEIKLVFLEQYARFENAARQTLDTTEN